LALHWLASWRDYVSGTAAVLPACNRLSANDLGSALPAHQLGSQVQTVVDSRDLEAIAAFPSPDGQHLAIMGGWDGQEYLADGEF